eukprot:c8681_g1_i2.p1 GENE.c8681_g1_i2~~c8681_g1_i2.p1  ORF type:complete len:162 (-),score=21.09 c8681_g1_i2:47-532(-)
MRKFDHHCDVIGSCVAQRNHRFFVAFLLTCSLGCCLLCIGCVRLLSQAAESTEMPHGSRAIPLAFAAVLGVVYGWTTAVLSCFGCAHFFLVCCASTTKATVEGSEGGAWEMVQRWAGLLCGWGCGEWCLMLRETCCAPIRSKWEISGLNGDEELRLVDKIV